MIKSIFDKEVTGALNQMFDASLKGSSKTVLINGEPVTVPYPFPSPEDWRDCWIYFLLIDRFNHHADPPKGNWNEIFDFRHGGNFKGIQQQLPYIASLGAKAIWISPVLKNSRPDWQYNYHGYATQDFLNLEGRFASDGTSETAEKELTELIEEAHARGIYVILDIVINHASRIFDYLYDGSVRSAFADETLLNTELGGEPPVQWLNGYGWPRADWQNELPSQDSLSADDAIWPAEFQRAEFFRRRGKLISDSLQGKAFVRGDFDTMRQLVVEYNAGVFPSQQILLEEFGPRPVLTILIRIYQYLIAKFDIDGFRIDTVKYIDPLMVESFGNAIREFALAVGKKNFFTFGEVYDDEDAIANFVGRNSHNTDGYGIDAALDFPLFYTLPQVIKGRKPVETIRHVFINRRKAEEKLLSSNGEAGRFFVSFLDNHDLHERFNHPLTPEQQVTAGLTALFCLQGIPCVYYGTEQGLSSIKDTDGNTVNKKEAVREALWGKQPIAFDETHPLFIHLKKLSALRKSLPALRYGRLYFREVSGNGKDFGHPSGLNGLVAFSRILSTREIVVAINTDTVNAFNGYVLVDHTMHKTGDSFQVAYSNVQNAAISSTVHRVINANLFERDQYLHSSDISAIPLSLAPMEAQVLVPVI